MGWTLDIRNPNGTGTKAALSNTALSGIRDGFSWQIDRHGNCIQLGFRAANRYLNMSGGEIVRFKVDDVPQFFGVVTRAPSQFRPNGPGGEVVILGGSELLKRRKIRSKAYRNAGIYTIVRELLSLYRHPALTYDATLIGDGTGTDVGPSLSLYYEPQKSLYDALTTLSGAMGGVPFGVDVQGRIFFGRPALAGHILDAAVMPTRDLEIEAEEVVTHVTVRVVSAPSPKPTHLYCSHSNSLGLLDYLPAPVTFELTRGSVNNDGHNQFQAEKVVDAPSGISLLKPYTPDLAAYSHTNVQNIQNAVDGNLETFASSVPNANQVNVNLEFPDFMRIYGARIRFAANADNDIGVQFRAHWSSYLVGSSGSFVSDTIRWTQAATGDVEELFFLFPHSERHINAGSFREQDINFAVYGLLPGENSFRLYDVVLFEVDGARASQYAERFFTTPFSSPTEIVVPSLLTPRPSVTVTRLNGNVNGPVDRYEYSLSRARGRQTLVRLGASGASDGARAIRLQATEIARTTTEPLRARLDGEGIT